VFHGRSGSSAQENAEAVTYGVVKVNVDTDNQYALTARFHRPRVRPLAGVLKVDRGWATSTASTRGRGAPASDRAATPLIDLD
jgi:Fructose-bisphosphate aldolase class-II